jgi:hypothetical protein
MSTAEPVGNPAAALWQAWAGLSIGRQSLSGGQCLSTPEGDQWVILR